ncbi:MAG: zinc metallopeptidase [Bacilli bacterium]|nr:zinc metallopeptidase [Bacilli bacterium]MDD4065434.1 zinc metallopeptidase [Bacilli bacterium]
MYYWYIMIGCFLIALIAQSAVTKSYNKYAQIENSRRMTGETAARQFLDANGLTDVDIQITNGILSDHYDVNRKTLYLSTRVFRDDSISSVAIACHEAGHAIQDATGYKALTVRNQILPIAAISNRFCWIIIILGILFQSLTAVYIGIGMFALIALFQLITLPVEFNASKRAMTYLEGNVLSYDEVSGANQVLRSAAMTYVAALLSSMLQIFYFLSIFGGRRR